MKVNVVVRELRTFCLTREDGKGLTMDFDRLKFG